MITGIFDTHAHYDDKAFDEDRDSLLNEIHEKNVSLILNCGCTVESSRKSLEMSEKYGFIYAAAGIHPEEIAEAKITDIDEIKKLAENKKAVAIGEIGLDYYWDTSLKKEQLEYFENQVMLANELDLPVVVHNREAHGDTLEILKKHKPKGVLHCFSGSKEMAREVLSFGMYIGFGGSLTFKNAVRPVENAEYVPLDMILLETDCPYMAPVPMRGKRNDSSLIEYVAVKMGEIKNLPPQTIADITRENGKRLFGI